MATAAWKIVTRLLEHLVRSRRPAPRRTLWRQSGFPTPDYVGCPDMVYGRTGPAGHSSGDVVWTWVAYEEDSSQGKDRPVLLVGVEEHWLLGLPATSKDHDRDASQERRAGRYWMEIGAGKWDPKGRVSEVRLDRIIRVDPTTIRRAAGHVDRFVFDAVAQGVRKHWDD